MDSRASRAEALLTPSRVMISSDTAGAVKFTAPQEVVVAVELVALAIAWAAEVVVVVVVSVEVVEVEARRRRKDDGRAAATAPAARVSHPPCRPLPAVRRRRWAAVVVTGQVVAVLPASEAAMVWLAESEVRVPVTCTSLRATPRVLRHVEMSHRTPWCTVGSAVVSLDLMPTMEAVLRVGWRVVTKVVCAGYGGS